MTFYVITTNFHGENSEIVSFNSEMSLVDYLISEIEKLSYTSISYNSNILQYSESQYRNMTIEELLKIIKDLTILRKKNFDFFSRFIFTIFNGDLIYK